jgi:PAS domain S-box-containing protein
LATLAKLASESRDAVMDDRDATIVQLQAQAQRHEAVLNAIAQGVCCFDAEDRVILSNRRFAEIYRLTPEQIYPGITLREVIELRIAAGTWAAAADDYLSFCVANHFSSDSIVWMTELPDGRLIQMRRQPMPGGGGVVTYDDITELKAARTAANERLSVQALIDRLPDNLWVKDVNSRFVIANQVTATRMGIGGPAELAGKTDLELLPPEIARKFFADEQEIIRTGQPMIDKEEFVFKSWISTTKVPLRNDRNEIFGVAGISRDITERKLADALRDGQAQILEMITMSAPLGDVLERLVLLIESQFKGVFASVLLLDETGTHLRHGAAPSLPDAYNKAIDGACIGPKRDRAARARIGENPSSSPTS